MVEGGMNVCAGDTIPSPHLEESRSGGRDSLCPNQLGAAAIVAVGSYPCFMYLLLVCPASPGALGTPHIRFPGAVSGAVCFTPF